jgi:hypothetical protein
VTTPYESIHLGVFAVLDSAAYKAIGLATVPAEYAESLTVFPQARLSILTGNTKPYTSQQYEEISGLIVLSLFLQLPDGALRAAQLADQLHPLFKQVTLASGTRTGHPFLTQQGKDKDDPTLYRADYMVPFTFFGVQ